MNQITVVLDLKDGVINGFKDIKQVASHLGMSEYKIKGILSKGGVHIAGTKIIGPLTLKKSGRGGNRTKE